MRKKIDFLSNFASKTLQNTLYKLKKVKSLYFRINKKYLYYFNICQKFKCKTTNLYFENEIKMYLYLYVFFL